MTSREGRVTLSYVVLFLCVAVLLGVQDRPIALADGMLRQASFASIYKPAVETINCATKGTYYEVPTWTVGHEHNLDGQTDGDIAIVTPGTYWISSSMSFDGVAGDNYIWKLHINGVAMPGFAAMNTAKTASGYSVCSWSACTSVSANWVLDVRIQDVGGTGNVNIDRAMFSAYRIGPVQ